MICLSLFIGTWSLTRSYPKHQKLLPVVVLILGFALIGSGHYLIDDLEAILIPLGGFTIAAAHFINWRYTRSCSHK
ncbi:MerC mercury resistance protein [compost metagenome]